MRQFALLATTEPGIGMLSIAIIALFNRNCTTDMNNLRFYRNRNNLDNWCMT